MTMLRNTKLLKVKGDWIDVLNDCRTTVRKDMKVEEPSIEFKRRILISEHSPIRSISIRWYWKGIKSWIATHWSRHKWECFITTQRTDRTGLDRDKLPQDTEVNFTGDANLQQLIDTMRKRLCYGNVAPETRAYAEDLKREIHTVDPIISQVLVPNCVYRCGCPEMQSCIFFADFKKEAEKLHVDVTSIQDRYNLYNQIFWR